LKTPPKTRTKRVSKEKKNCESKLRRAQTVLSIERIRKGRNPISIIIGGSEGTGKRSRSVSKVAKIQSIVGKKIVT